MEITVFSKPSCGGCTLVKAYLDGRGIDYIEKDVTVDSEALGEIQAQGYLSLPVTRFLDKGAITYVNGYNPEYFDNLTEGVV